MPDAQTVLVVDDDALVREVVTELIVTLFASEVTEGRLRVEGAADGAAAVAACCRRAPALVLMDIGMPSQDGIDVFYAMRAGAASIPPVVFLTAHGADGTIGERLRQAIADGALGHVQKPVHLADIEALVRRFVPLA